VDSEDNYLYAKKTMTMMDGSKTSIPNDKREANKVASSKPLRNSNAQVRTKSGDQRHMLNQNEFTNRVSLQGAQTLTHFDELQSDKLASEALKVEKMDNRRKTIFSSSTRGQTNGNNLSIKNHA